MHNNTVENLMELLKEGTRPMHDSAESSQFQSKLANAALSQDGYADYLEQLYLVHSRLEREMLKNSGEGKPCANIVTSDQLQEPFLKQDLEKFGRNIEQINPLPATRKLLDEIDYLSEHCPVALLGMHYVLLGSKHGGKFIAKNCQEKYKLNDGRGVVYFDPYGQSFMPLWKSFKEAMNNLRPSKEEAGDICNAAATMFMAVGEIGGQLLLVAK